MRKQTEHEFRGRFGKMVKGVSSLLLDEDQLSDSQNMQPGYGWRQRRGMSALTASAVATGLRFKSMIQFRDLRGFTNVILAHTYDSVNGDRIMEGSALPPNAITWSEKYTLTAGGEICDFGVTSGAVLIANDKDFLIWRGNESLPTGVFFYDGSTDKFLNYWEETTDFNDDTVLPLAGYDATDLDAVYLISEQPLEKIVVGMNDINAVMSFTILQYWNGAFTEVTSRSTGGTFADGTKKSGDPVIDEFTGNTINASLWQGPFGSMSAYMTQDDALIMEQAMNGDASLNTSNRLHLSGDFSIVGKLNCVDTVHGAGSDANSMRLYVYKVGQSNTNGYIGRFARTAPTETAHFSAIYTVGVKQDEQWTNVGIDEDIVCWYKIERIGTALSIYWYSDRIGDWTLEATDATWVTDDVYIGLFSRNVDYTKWDGDPEWEYIRIGTPLNQNGEITWTPPTDEVATSLQNIPGFVYKLKWLDDINGSIAQLGVGAPLGPVENIWFGQDTFPTGCYVYNGTDYTDYTAYVNNNVESQAAVLDAATTSYALYVGFAQRMSQVTFYPASLAQNTADAQIDAVEYSDNTGAFVSVGTFVDNTLDGAADSSFSQKGAIQWVAPAEEDEKATTVGGDTTPMYWYKFEWDATLSDPTQIYLIRGVPYPEEVDPSYGVFGHKMRAWQIAPVRNENAVRYSASGLPNVWNGLDSGYMYFGERPLRAGVTYYNEAVVFADSEIWMIKGTSPSNFSRLRLSEKVGISAPRSLVNIESGVVVSESIKNILVWFYNDGIWMFDNAKIWKISAPDIDSFFDPDHPDYINPAYLDQTYGEYDFDLQIAKWIVYSGANATTPTKMIVMHFPSMWFGIFDYGTDVSSLLSVLNNRYYTVAGGFDNGKFYLLNDGITDVDTDGNTVAVDAFVTTRDQFLTFSEGMRERLMSIWVTSKEAGGLMELDEYPDGSRTPQNIAKKSMTFLGKIFGALQRTLRLWDKQKTTKFRIRNRSKNSRMILLGHSTTVDRGRSDE